MKNFLTIFIAILIPLKVLGEENWEGINKVIDNYKKYIYEKYDECINNKINKYFYVNLIVDTAKIRHVEELHKTLSGLLKVKNCEGSSIYNKTFCNLILELLNIVNEKKELTKLVQYIYDIGNADYFKENSLKLKEILMRYTKEWDLANLILLKCELDENEKNSIKKDLLTHYRGDIPLEIKVLLGEKGAEDTLLQLYRHENNFGNLRIILKQIEFAGTKNCELELVKSLGVKNACNGEYSIKFFIIETLGKLIPDAVLLNEEFKEFQNKIGKSMRVNYAYKSITKEYLNKLYNWIYEKYNLKIEELKNVDYIYICRLHSTPLPLGKY